MDEPINVAQLAREAGIPADDPGVLAFAKLVAEACASLCDRAQPIGDADHVPAAHAGAVGRELGTQIRAVFDVW